MKFETLADGIIQITFEGILDAEQWRNYKKAIIEHLDNSTDLQFILTDLSQLEDVDKNIISEFGSAPHLTHEKLGFLVLLGGNAFQQFISKITEGNALRNHRAQRLRVHYDREGAMQWLYERRDLENNIPS